MRATLNIPILGLFDADPYALKIFNPNPNPNPSPNPNPITLTLTLTLTGAELEG